MRLDAKKNFYKEARRALDKHRTSRGFYSDKGKGKSKGGQNSEKGFTGRCMRCGKVGHKAMNCRQSIMGASASGGKGADSGRVGFVFVTGLREEHVGAP